MNTTSRNNLNNSGAIIKKNSIRNETQTSFYKKKNNKTKTDNMIGTFHDTGSFVKLRVPTTSNKKEPPLPAIKFNEFKSEDLDSSKSFQITNNELKNGITLDKVLGCGFKKIDIYDANLKEFEKKQYSSMIEDEINEMSDPEGYEYDDFEILESENEEDPNNESNNYVNTKRRKQDDRSVDLKNSSSVQNDIDDIRDRINKKYKSKHKATTFKKNTFKLVKSPELNSTEQIKPLNVEDIYSAFTTQESQPYQRESSRKLENNNSVNKFESKSLSPECLPEMRKSKFQATNSVFSEKSRLYAGEINGFNTFKSSFYAGNTNTSNFGLESDSTFRGTNNFKNRSESFKMDEKRNTKYSKNSSNKPLNQAFHNIDDVSRTTSSLFISEKFSDTSIKFFNEKLYNGSQVEQKYVKENQVTTEKLKQEEKNLLDKYARKFNLRTEECNYSI